MTATNATDARQATRAIAAEIAAQLGETEPEPLQHLYRAVRNLGEDRVRALVTQARVVEETGGMLVPDGSRRRTLGGVFFSLVRDEVGRKEFYRIFRPQGDPKDKATAPAAAAGSSDRTVAAVGEPFDEATFKAAAVEAMSEVAEATTVKLTVIGRPGKVVERGDVVLVGMRSEKVPSLPKGVPVPTSPQTDYMVLVGVKHWRKVEAALAADPADKVIVEGYPTVRPEFAGITVYATSATTTGLRAGKRAAQAT